MTPELEAIVAEAQADPKGFVPAVIASPEKLALLATVKVEERSSYEWLLAKFKQAKVEHLANLKSAITAVTATLNGHEQPGPITATDTLAALAAEIDPSATAFESTAVILDDVATFVIRYVSFPDHRQADAVALWIVHTWAIDSFDITPRLSVQAPQRESGKTRLLEACGVLILKPRMWILPSPAVIYRTLDLGATSFLLDEVDAIFRGRNADKHDELRAIINEGYSRNGTVPRMVFDPDGKHMKVVEFPVFAPTALAGIGGIHDTIESRSLVIRLQRQKRSGRAAKFRRREVEPRAKALRDRLTLWAGVYGADLRAARPVPPDGLSDRAEDIWEPLLAIAELGGEEWRKRADEAAVYLAARARDRADDPTVGLLRDIRTIFDGFSVYRMHTAQLLERLCAMEESPWKAWGSARRRDPGINATDLARMLGEFDIKPKQLRIGEEAGLRGYERADFVDAWDRYLNNEDDETEGVEGA
jgi:hypothetical protein